MKKLLTRPGYYTEDCTAKRTGFACKRNPSHFRQKETGDKIYKLLSPFCCIGHFCKVLHYNLNTHLLGVQITISQCFNETLSLQGGGYRRFKTEKHNLKAQAFTFLYDLPHDLVFTIKVEDTKNQLVAFLSHFETFVSLFCFFFACRRLPSPKNYKEMTFLKKTSLLKKKTSLF